jgi:FkbM family methyltransferase
MGEEAHAYLAGECESVIWFEADSSIISSLEANLKQISLRHQIIPVALWDENAVLKFKVANNFQSSSFFDFGTHQLNYPSIKFTEERDVRVYRLDDLITRHKDVFIFNKFDFINIDTQGAEFRILSGMGELLTQESILGIYLEINKEEVYKNISLVTDIDTLLSKFGFFRVKTAWTNAGWGDAFYLRSVEDYSA